VLIILQTEVEKAKRRAKRNAENLSLSSNSRLKKRKTTLSEAIIEAVNFDKKILFVEISTPRT